MEDLEGRTVRGGLAKLCAQATSFVLRVTFMVALARLLSPEDFGLVGMVTVATGLINILTHTWLSSGSVQQATVDERQLSTLFWVYVAFGAFLCALCVAAAPAIAAFYDEPRLCSVTVILGFGCLFSTAGVQHYAILQRQLRYVALAVVEAVSLSVSIAVGVTMALKGYGYWALVGATVVLPACNTICLWLVTRWIPGLPHRDANIGLTMRFGGLIIFNISIVYIAYNLDKVRPVARAPWRLGPFVRQAAAVRPRWSFVQSASLPSNSAAWFATTTALRGQEVEKTVSAGCR